ncbi:MAG: periplasmic heavy metal sensor [Rhizobiales bacterium]|nr:periplasmic heavy metal sensor [Hyphomicrobiales bacterium]OJY01481.1 MAG: hypothetical protein BGP07_12605 [Rhizobiales bacterium 63-22]
MASSRLPLIVSVALNVFLLGGLIGGALWVHSHGPLPGGTLQAAVRSLPPDQRVALHKALRAVRLENRPTMIESRQARRDAANLLRQPTLDAAALSAALQRARTADVTMRAKLEQRIVDFAATSSQQVRDLLADGLIRRLPPPRKAR